MKIFTRVNIVFVWTTKPGKYKNDDVKTLNQATVSDVSRALNKHALARICLVTNKHCARNKSKISAYFVSQVSQSTFSIVRAVLYSRTTFRSNSTTSSDQIKLSNLFFFDLDDHSTEFRNGQKAYKHKISSYLFTPRVDSSLQLQEAKVIKQEPWLHAGFCRLVSSTTHALNVFCNRFQIYTGTCRQAKTIRKR